MYAVHFYRVSLKGDWTAGFIYFLFIAISFYFYGLMIFIHLFLIISCGCKQFHGSRIIDHKLYNFLKNMSQWKKKNLDRILLS